MGRGNANRIAAASLGAGVLVALLAGATAALSCGGKHAPPTTSSACDDLFAALTTYATCAPPVDPHLATLDRFVLHCTQDLDAPGAGPSTAVAESCASALRAAAQTCSQVDPTACAVPPGTLAAGAPCGAALQCESGMCISTAPAATDVLGSFLALGASMATCGTCADPVPAGGACTVSFAAACNSGCSDAPAPCALGAACVVDTDALVEPDGALATAGVCVAFTQNPAPPADAGAPSGNGGPCAPAGCLPAYVCGPNGTCAPRLAQGEVCTVGGVDLCAGGMVCTGTPATCEPATYGAPGASCDGIATFCAAGSCKVVGPYSPGTCPPVIAEGQPCGPSDAGAICDDYAACAPESTPAACCALDAAPSPGAGLDAGAGTCVLLDPSTCQ